MIGFIQRFFPIRQVGLIRLRMPARSVVLYNCERERIDALIDEQNRVRLMVVHTVQDPPKPRRRSRLHR